MSMQRPDSKNQDWNPQKEHYRLNNKLYHPEYQEMSEDRFAAKPQNNYHEYQYKNYTSGRRSKIECSRSVCVCLSVVLGCLLLVCLTTVIGQIFGFMDLRLESVREKSCLVPGNSSQLAVESNVHASSSSNSAFKTSYGYWHNHFAFISYKSGGSVGGFHISKNTLHNLPSKYFGESERGEPLSAGTRALKSLFLSAYFLCKQGEKMYFHMIRSETQLHHYDGAPFRVHVIYPNGTYGQHLLGKDVKKDQSPQIFVELGSYFAGEIDTAGADGFALLGVTATPSPNYPGDFIAPIQAKLRKVVHNWPALKKSILPFVRTK